MPATRTEPFPMLRPARTRFTAIDPHTKVKPSRLASWMAALLLVVTALPGQAQTGTITYQGRLQEGGIAATGSFDMAFSIWDKPSGPTQIGGIVTNLGLAVSNGIFTASLDFGPGVFEGSDRWLEIGVRRGVSAGFVPLVPRQRVNATPYAIHAANVNGAGISGTIPAGSIGTSTITAGMLAPGAVAESLSGGGQTAMPAGAIVFSGSEDDTNLTRLGYSRVGGYINAPNLWRDLGASPLAPRAGHAAYWTGSRMIVWGGQSGNDNPNYPPLKVRNVDGGIYDPATKIWTSMATNGAPAGREQFASVWTGSEMLVWGGFFYDGSYHYLGDGARYHAASNTWGPIPATGAPSGRHRHTAVWTGREMIVWGGMASAANGLALEGFQDGARFDPVANKWTPMSTSGAPIGRCNHTAVWTGKQMIVWGGIGGNDLQNPRSDGGLYDPANDTWLPMTLTDAPDARAGHSAVWTGKEMIVWGGGSTGGHYDPVKDAWSPTEYVNAPASRSQHTAVWTGREMVVWGGTSSRGPSFSTNDGGAYNPTTHAWVPMATIPWVPTGRQFHSAVWTGREMIIIGGTDGSGHWFGDFWSSPPPQTLFLYQKP